MIKQGDGFYKFRTKDHWRRTMWKGIKARLLVPTKDAVVLYMPGPENLDMPVAVGLGFRKDNLIGVDRSEEISKQLRKTGQLCIHGDFWTVVDSWSKTTPLHVLFPDFTGPLVNDTYRGTLNAMSCHSQKTGPAGLHVLAANVLAGREVIDKFEVFGGVRPCGSNRWEIFIFDYFFRTLQILEQLKLGRDIATGIMQKKIADMSPSYMSYTSHTGQRFDSIISRLAGSGFFQIDKRTEDRSSAKTSRQITSILAHRTMRQGSRCSANPVWPVESVIDKYREDEMCSKVVLMTRRAWVAKSAKLMGMSASDIDEFSSGMVNWFYDETERYTL
jgi:hypothetical protein